MVIYGVALLAFCMLVGTASGKLIGVLIGIDANVGGVGIAMLLLLFLTNIGSERFKLKPISESGIAFWTAMYIPIVVAMAAKQDVYSAINGGMVALVAGLLAVIVSFALIPVLTRMASRSDD